MTDKIPFNKLKDGDFLVKGHWLFIFDHFEPGAGAVLESDGGESWSGEDCGKQRRHAALALGFQVDTPGDLFQQRESGENVLDLSG